MKPMLLALVLMIGAPFAWGADAGGVTFYIQLVRGTDMTQSPEPQAHSIGTRLDHRLRGIFKWKNYWEVKRESVVLHSGAKIRQRMSPEREVELAWAAPHEMTISLYTKGRLVARRQQAIDTRFYISGGDRDASDCWFIIVRKDNPGSEPAGMVTKLAEMP